MADQPGTAPYLDKADFKTMTLRQGTDVSSGEVLTTDKDGKLIKPNFIPGASTRFPDGFVVAVESMDADKKDEEIQVVTAGSMIRIRLAAGVRAGQRLESVPASNSKFRGASHSPIPHSIIGTVIEVDRSKRVSDDGDVGTVLLGCGC